MAKAGKVKPWRWQDQHNYPYRFKGKDLWGNKSPFYGEFFRFDLEKKTWRGGPKVDLEKQVWIEFESGLSVAVNREDYANQLKDYLEQLTFQEDKKKKSLVQPFKKAPLIR